MQLLTLLSAGSSAACLDTSSGWHAQRHNTRYNKKRVGKRALWCGRAKAVSLGAVVIAPAAC